MDKKAEQALSQLTTKFFFRNYDYLFLRTMLEQAANTKIPGSTLITGSSHALSGIVESCWKNAFNCSMYSQDIYYDFQCARRVLHSVPRGRFTRCFMIMGYYIAYQDLSRSKVSRETMITNIYYPIFGDAHNWGSPVRRDLWTGIGDIPGPLKALCEQAASRKLLEYRTYYSELRPRGTLFDLKGRSWAQVPQTERMAMGQIRAADHNKLFQHKESLEENKQILREYVGFLIERDILPVVVITPFSPEYNRFVRPEMKSGVLELLDSVPQDVHYVDFNQALEIFEAEDFMDTDHLSEQGAKKVSHILVELFGE